MSKRSKIEEDALRAIERNNQPMTIEEAKEFMRMQYDAEWDQYRREAALRFMATSLRMGVIPPKGKDTLTFAAEMSVEAVEAADALIKQLTMPVEGQHEEAEPESKPSEDNEPDGITTVEQDGRKWVRVKIYDEDFMLAVNDFEKDGKTEFKWQEAMDAVDEVGLTMPNFKQWSLVMAYKDEINRQMQEAGGEPLTGAYWSVARYYSGYAWLYNGLYGGLFYGSLYYAYSVRPLAYFKS